MPPLLPLIEEDKLVHVGLWPHTTKADWCGEWEKSDASEGLTEPPSKPGNLFSS
jgi:hypothetical protein